MEWNDGMENGTEQWTYKLQLTRVTGTAQSRLASFPGAEEEGERAPGAHCLRMRVIYKGHVAG